MKVSLIKIMACLLMNMEFSAALPECLFVYLPISLPVDNTCKYLN